MLIDKVATHNLTYTKWVRKVDLTVAKRIGRSVYDLDDCPLRDWFEDGLAPLDAANEVLANEGMDLDDEDDMADMMAEIHDYFPRDACVPEGMHDGGYAGAYVGPYGNLDGLYEL